MWPPAAEVTSRGWNGSTCLKWPHAAEVAASGWSGVMRLKWPHAAEVVSSDWSVLTRLQWHHAAEVASRTWSDLTRLKWPLASEDICAKLCYQCYIHLVAFDTLAPLKDRLYRCRMPVLVINFSTTYRHAVCFWNPPIKICCNSTAQFSCGYQQNGWLDYFLKRHYDTNDNL